MRLIDADALIQDLIDKKIPFNADVNEAILSARTIGGYADYVDRVWEIAYERGKEEALPWISCSEQLPDEDGKYIVFGYLEGKEEITVCGFYTELGRFGASWNFDIKAWMELPQLYGGDEE